MLPLFLRSMMSSAGAATRGVASGALSVAKKASNPIGALFDASGGKSIPILSKIAGKIGSAVRSTTLDKSPTLTPVAKKKEATTKKPPIEKKAIVKKESTAPATAERTAKVTQTNKEAHAQNLDAAGASDADKQTGILSKMQQDIAVIKENTAAGIGGGGEGGVKSGGGGFFGLLLIAALTGLAGKLMGFATLFDDLPAKITAGLEALPGLIAGGLKGAESAANSLHDNILTPIVSHITGKKNQTLGSAIYDGIERVKLVASDPFAGTSFGTNRGLEKVAGLSLVQKVNSPELKELIKSSPYIKKFANKHGVDKTANILNKTYVAGSSEVEIMNELERLKDDPKATSSPIVATEKEVGAAADRTQSFEKLLAPAANDGIGTSTLAPAANDFSVASLLNAETEKAAAAMTPSIVVQVPPQPPAQVVVAPSSKPGGGGGVGGGASAPMIIRTQESTLQRLSDSQFSFSMP
jgi:hypothetical protein